jgi:hypothetical protein
MEDTIQLFHQELNASISRAGQWWFEDAKRLSHLPSLGKAEMFS